MSRNSFNEAAYAETHRNGSIATAATSWNFRDEAASAERPASVILQQQEGAAKVAMKLQVQKCTTSIALQLQK